MNKIARKAVILLVIFALAFVTAGFCSCGSGLSGVEPGSSETIQTNPNDDGFGTEVGM